MVRPVARGSLFVGGCTNSYDVKLDSLAKPRAIDAISYKIHSANPAIAEDSLRHREAVGFVRTALSGKGMYETTDAEKADVVVDLDYGVGPPQVHRELVSEPVFASQPVGIRYEREAVGVDRAGNVIYQTIAVPVAHSADPPATATSLSPPSSTRNISTFPPAKTNPPSRAARPPRSGPATSRVRGKATICARRSPCSPPPPSIASARIRTAKKSFT